MSMNIIILRYNNCDGHLVWSDMKKSAGLRARLAVKMLVVSSKRAVLEKNAHHVHYNMPRGESGT